MSICENCQESATKTLPCLHGICEECMHQITEFNNSQCPAPGCDSKLKVEIDPNNKYENILRLIDAHSRLLIKKDNYDELVSIGGNGITRVNQFEFYSQLMSDLAYINVPSEYPIFNEIKLRYKLICTTLDEIDRNQIEIDTAIKHCLALMSKNKDIDDFLNRVLKTRYTIDFENAFSSRTTIDVNINGLFLNYRNEYRYDIAWASRYREYDDEYNYELVLIADDYNKQCYVYNGIEYNFPKHLEYHNKFCRYDIFKQDVLLGFGNEDKQFICYHKAINMNDRSTIENIDVSCVISLTDVLFSKNWIILCDYFICHCLDRKTLTYIYKVDILADDMRRYTFKQRDEQISAYFREIIRSQKEDDEIKKEHKESQIYYDVDVDSAEYDELLQSRERNKKPKKKLTYY